MTKVTELKREATKARVNARRDMRSAKHALRDMDNNLSDIISGKMSFDAVAEEASKKIENAVASAKVANEATTKHKKGLFVAVTAIEQALAEHPEGLTAVQISNATNGLLSPISITLAAYHAGERKRCPRSYNDGTGSCYGVHLGEYKEKTRRFCTVELDEDGEIIPGSKVVTEKTETVKLYKATGLTATTKEFLGV